MTRFGFHASILIWLGLLVFFVDIAGNTANTGVLSDVFMGKTIFDVLLAFWTFMYLKEDIQGTTVHRHQAESSWASAKGREQLISFEKLGGLDYVYYGVIAAYTIGNLVLHWSANKHSTGLESIWYLIWVLMDVVLCVVAIVQISAIANGKLVQIRKNNQGV